MNLIHIFTRISQLLLHPNTEWAKIDMENQDKKTVFRNFVLPMLFMVIISSIIGSALFASRMVYSFNYVISKIAILFCSLSAGIYIVSYLIAEITSLEMNQKRHNRVFSLVAYTMGPVFIVISLVQLFPFFNELLVLSLYSGYIYWQGIPHLLKIEGHKKMVVGIMSFVLVAVVTWLLIYFFGHVFRAIFIKS